jgi:OmpA-OmpF porin, OOP family
MLTADTLQDSDADGVIDALDECPYLPAVDPFFEHPGCPRPRACLSITTDIRIAQRVYFARGSPVVRPESAPVVDAIAQMLTQHPALDTDIAGHCEKPEPKALGAQRAEAVRAALVLRGVDAARLHVADTNDCEPPNEAARSVDFPATRERK